MAVPLSIAFLLLPDFTMLALAGFLDTLRLAADEGDRSRPIDCRWTVLSESGGPVRASNGVEILPDAAPGDLEGVDYVVVVGGTLHRRRDLGEGAQGWLRAAAAGGLPLVGICTGGFALARAGLMARRRCCVSWFHRAEFEAEFPEVETVADRLFVVDRDRITCAGGTSVIHLASYLIDRHLGPGRSTKGLRIMIEDRPRGAGAAQPPPPIAGLDNIRDNRIRRAMLLIERDVADRDALSSAATKLAMSPRHLARLFRKEVGLTPREYREALRLARAEALVVESTMPLTEIALRCGFADGAHFSRTYRRRFMTTPAEARRTRLTEVAEREGFEPSRSC